MKADLLKDFIEKLNIMIENCEKIWNDKYLMKNVDLKIINNRKISIHEDACFFYKNGDRDNFFVIDWNNTTLTLDSFMLETTIPRNELDLILLCLESPTLRNYNTETIKEVICLCDDISERIKIHSRT